jgi:hypothetical protein
MAAPLVPLGFNSGPQDWPNPFGGFGFLPAPPGFGWFDVGGWNPGYFYDPWQPLNAVGMPLPPPNGGSAPGSGAQNPHNSIANEPGYSYVFPKETCKIHVINSRIPPWQNDGGYHLNCYNVPCNIKLKELLQQFGCNNEKAALNKVHELAQGGNGRWYKGLTFSGDNGTAMGKTLKDVGWDETRNGVDKDFIWVWFTKG